MSTNSQQRQAAAVRPLQTPAKLFAVFSFVLALLAVLTFWPPRSPAVIAWLSFWTALCLATGVSILRRGRYAPALVWMLTIAAACSAFAALKDGLLQGIGILIDIFLFAPMVWFAIWYQRSRRVESATTGPPRPSQ